MDEVAAEWRRRFLATVEQIDDDPEPITLQSGGLDSLTMTAAQLALGRRPRLVTFTIGGRRYDDLIRVERLAKRFDLSLTVVEIPETEDQLVADIREAVAAGATNKVPIQCYQPCAHMGRAILAKWGPSTVWLGTGGIGEDIRAVAVALAQQGEEAARVLRTKSLVDGGSPGSGEALMWAALTASKHRPVGPYAHPSFAPYSLTLDQAEIDSPRQKGIAVRAFRDFYDRALVMPQRNSGMQVGAGIRAWHDTLLRSPRYNREGHRAIIAVYRRINDL